MAQVIVNLTRVQVFESEEFTNVNLVFNEQIDGFKKSVDDAGIVDFVEDKVNYLSIGRSALIAQLCEANDLIADYRATIDHSFGQKEFGIILRRGTVLTLNRERHSAGEVYGQDEDGNDLAFSRDSYTTDIIDVKLTPRSIEKLEKATDL